MSKRLAIPLVALVVTATLVVVAADSCERDPPNVTAPDAGPHQEVGVPDVSDSGNVDAGWVAVSTEDDGDFVALVDGAPTTAEFTIGAAGHYPPATVTAAATSLPEPTKTMDGVEIGIVEVYARTPAGDAAFWGDVPTDANAIELTATQPARVRVVGLLGKPVVGVEVRLGREIVGLVHRQAVTDSDGWAAFDALPQGEYIATASARQAPVVDVASGSEAEIVLEPGRKISGTVRDEGGRPVADATVAVTGSEAGTDPRSDLPADIVRTDRQGAYAVSGVRGAQFGVLVTAPGFQPSVATKTPLLGDDVVLDATMLRGRNVKVRVVDEQQRQLEGATVRWLDPLTGAGGAGLSKLNALLELSGVPKSAEISAQLGNFESGAVSVSSTADVVDLVLRNTDRRIWRYRVEMPDDLPLLNLEAHDGSGTRCGVSTADGRDFTLMQCGEGGVTLEVATPLGLAVVRRPKFRDGDFVDVPGPTSVEITVSGAVSEAWEQTTFSVNGPNADVVPIAVERLSDGRRITASMYPGMWTFTARNGRVGATTMVLEVADEPVKVGFELFARHLFRLQIVDTYGSPVTGAYAMLFDGNRLVEVARSGGQLPTEFRVKPPFEGTVLVVDPQRGEGTATLTTEAADSETRITLTNAVLTAKVPNGRQSAAQLEARLGLSLVRSDRGFALDVRPDSVAAKSGLQRGDLLVTAWPDGSTMRVIARRKKTYIDVRVP